MTEAVILALIALVGALVISALTPIILVKILADRKPSLFIYSTEKSNLEVRFDAEADE